MKKEYKIKRLLISATKIPNWRMIAVLQFLSGVLGFIGLPLLIPVLKSYEVGVNKEDTFSQIVHKGFELFNLQFNPDVLLGVVFILLLFSLALEAFVQYRIHYSQYHLFSKLNKLLMQKYQNVSWPWLVANKSGEINHALYNEASGTAHNSFQALQFLVSAFQLSLYGLLTILLSWKAMLIVICISAIVLFINVKISNIIKRASYEKNNLQQEFSKITQTIQQNKKLLKSFGNFDLLSVDYNRHVDAMVTSANIIAKHKQYQRFVTTFVFISIIVVLIGLQNRMNIPIENILILLVVFARILPYVQSLIGSLSAYMEGEPIAQSFSEKITSLSLHKEEHGESQYLSNTNIYFSNVDFSYDNQRKILTSCSFEIKPLEITALVGESGSGKSTVLDLILGLLRPSKGEIFYGNISSNNMNYESFRQHISYVNQETTLIAGSIYDNLVFGNDQTSQEEVLDVCSKVLLLDFVQSLPEGLSTDIGENGVLLSGGQKQRLAIGRALIAKRNVVILDEATSALDMESERMIQETISALKGIITIILVTHRLEMIKNADAIYEIKDYQAKKIEKKAVYES